MKKVILLLLVTFFGVTTARCTTDTSFIGVVKKIETVSKKTVKLFLTNENNDSIYVFTHSTKEYPVGTKLKISFDKMKPKKRTIENKEAVSAEIEIL